MAGGRQAGPDPEGAAASVNGATRLSHLKSLSLKRPTVWVSPCLSSEGPQQAAGGEVPGGGAGGTREGPELTTHFELLLRA